MTASQYGLLSRQQALAAGLTTNQITWLLHRGSWIRELPRVYRAAAAPQTWQQPLMAACLWAGGKAVIARRSAAAVGEFEGYWRNRVELTGLSDLTAPEGVDYYQVSRLSAADIITRRGIRVTTVARTLVDVASVVSPRTLERTLDEVLRKQLVTLTAVRFCIQRGGPRRRKGVALLESLIGERYQQHSTDSPLETDLAAFVREAGLPRPVKRYNVIEGDRLVAEVDLAWPDEKVAVQAHGASFHRQLRTWENDQRTENELQLHGWMVVKITTRMLADDPEGAVALIERALRRSAA